MRIGRSLSHDTTGRPSPSRSTRGGYVPEAAVNDTLAKNRSCPVVEAASVPHPPSGSRATDPKVRSKRLRKLDSTLRSEGCGALREAAKRGAAMKTELGTFAPDPPQAAPLIDRLKVRRQKASAGARG